MTVPAAFLMIPNDAKCFPSLLDVFHMSIRPIKSLGRQAMVRAFKHFFLEVDWTKLPFLTFKASDFFSAICATW